MIMTKDTHNYINRFCAQCGFYHSVRLYCGDRLCPDCRKTNYYRLRNFYLPLIKKIPAHRLSQLTLTYKNTPYLTKSYLDSFTKDLNRLRRTKFFRSKVKGALMTIECKHKNDSTGWNLHAHLLLDSSFIPQKELAVLWRSITGHSFIVDVRREKNSRHAILHLLKYFVKVPIVSGSDLKELNRQYNQTFFGSRNIVSFGSLYNAVAEDYLPYRHACPRCGSVEWFTEFDLIKYEKRAIPIEFSFG